VERRALSQAAEPAPTDAALVGRPLAEQSRRLIVLRGALQSGDAAVAAGARRDLAGC
jgi:hypothetical protein